MANADNPFGLRSLGFTIEGGCPVVDEFSKDASGGVIFQGDVFAMEADGYITATGLTPGTTLYSGVSLNYSATGVAGTHQAIISPRALFQCQDNNDVDGFALADRGLNANLELNGGSTTTLQSGHELDESTLNASASRDAHVLDKLNVPDNAYGANCRVVIIFNQHRMAPASVGV